MARPLILCYHAVSESWPAPLASTPGQLRSHLKHLRARRFEPATLSDALAAPREKRTVAITFDDAFASVLEVAKPILDEFGFVATIFPPTGFIGAGHPMRWPEIEHWIDSDHESDLRPMSWQQLRDCQEAGWEIGSHTVSHPHLPLTTDEELRRELIESRAACEAELGRACPTLAYPYGERDERVVAAAAEAGYKRAVTLPNGFAGQSPLEIARVGVYRGDDIWRFRAKPPTGSSPCGAGAPGPR